MQTWQTFAGSSFSVVSFCHFFSNYIVVNWITFGVLDGWTDRLKISPWVVGTWRWMFSPICLYLFWPLYGLNDSSNNQNIKSKSSIYLMDEIHLGSSVNPHSNCGPHSCIHTCRHSECVCTLALIIIWGPCDSARTQVERMIEWNNAILFYLTVLSLLQSNCQWWWKACIAGKWSGPLPAHSTLGVA